MQNTQASKKSQAYQVIKYSVNTTPNSKALDIMLSKRHSSYFYCIPKLHHCVDKSPLQDSFLSQLNPIHTSTSHFSNTHFKPWGANVKGLITGVGSLYVAVT